MTEPGHEDAAGLQQPASRPTVLITGALGGIGTALCRVFRASGYRVIATDRRPDDGANDEYLRFDIARLATEEAYRTRVLSDLTDLVGPSGLKLLINNAAIQLLHGTDDVTVDELHETFDTNLIGPFLLVQGLLPLLERAHGSVINMSSVHATATKPGFVAYATSKAALVGLTRTLAVDLGSRLRVNAILPAATDTPMLRAGFEGNPDGLAELGAMHPIGRIASPDEVAHVAVFLASEAAAVITGAAFAVDGGIGVRLHDPV